MPYIKKTNPENDFPVREYLQQGYRALNAGELNYQIFYFIKHNYKLDKTTESLGFVIIKFIFNFLGENPNYQKYNDMTGALIRCQKELKRRLNIKIDLYSLMENYDDEIAKYEDTKIISNGDVE